MVYQFANAALPWVLMGVVVAAFIVFFTNKENKNNS